MFAPLPLHVRPASAHRRRHNDPSWRPLTLRPTASPQLLVDEGILVECVDTRNSVATFNVLQQEGRNVLGAMLPVTAGG